MNGKQTKTLRAIFAEPTRSTIAWDDIERLLIAIGCEVVEGAGSRVRFAFRNDEIESFHRPHPHKEAKKYQVRMAREFLKRIGVRP
jgi:HicA toxin of bacterial toxin-antitoxin,